MSAIYRLPYSGTGNNKVCLILGTALELAGKSQPPVIYWIPLSILGPITGFYYHIGVLLVDIAQNNQHDWKYEGILRTAWPQD